MISDFAAVDRVELAFPRTDMPLIAQAYFIDFYK